MTEILSTISKKDRNLKKFTYRGYSLEQLMSLEQTQMINLLNSRQKRRFQRTLSHKYSNFISKLRKSKTSANSGEKPEAVKTHMRNAIVVPEMVGSVVGIHNGKSFSNVEIKLDMIGSYLGEYSLTYKPIVQGKPGIGATKGSSHVRVK